MNPTGFALHPQLAKDCVHVCDMGLSRVLLMNDSRFPWLILVPMRARLRDLHDLEPNDYSIVMQEIRIASEHLARMTNADKMNVAALGNMVPQLHIHVIARFQGDAAWPSPVWGCAPGPAPYAPDALAQRAKEIQRALA